ncbi:MAG: hypothetical protein K1Y36_15810 [Blastocatellia bacterium]|nr:hypothetical protein [Blastocatellia bacterium]
MKPMWSVFFAILVCFFSTTSTTAQDAPLVPKETKKAGKYAVTLRLPELGLYAEDEQQIEFRLTDTSRTDPVLGAAPVIRADIKSIITMPEMPSMPSVDEVAHPEGVPGDYGLHPTFAHGGDFVLLLRITPPGVEPFTIEFPLTVADTAPAVKAKNRIKPYRVELKTEPVRVKAGEPVKLQFKVFASREIKDAKGEPTGKRESVQVKEFDIVHEKLLHLIMVRKDLGFYAHEHPHLQPDGTFVLEGFAFPTAGDYNLFADTAPKGAGSQVLGAPLKVEGKVQPAAKPVSSTGKFQEQTHDGVTVARVDDQTLPAKKTTLLSVTLKDAQTQKPITDLEPYLGAMGHLVMIHTDSQTYVHSHPDERDPQNGKNGTLTFLVRPPKAGTYRGWFEFQRKGKLSRAEFVFTVQ